jgi:hypothetical protein
MLATRKGTPYYKTTIMSGHKAFLSYVTTRKGLDVIINHGNTKDETGVRYFITRTWESPTNTDMNELAEDLHTNW